MRSTLGSSAPRLQLPRTHQKRDRPKSIRLSAGRADCHPSRGGAVQYGRHGGVTGTVAAITKGTKGTFPPAHINTETPPTPGKGSSHDHRVQAERPSLQSTALSQRAPTERPQTFTHTSFFFRAGSQSSFHKVTSVAPGASPASPSAAVQTEKRHAPRHQRRSRTNHPARISH